MCTWVGEASIGQSGYTLQFHEIGALCFISCLQTILQGLLHFNRVQGAVLRRLVCFWTCMGFHVFSLRGCRSLGARVIVLGVKQVRNAPRNGIQTMIDNAYKTLLYNPLLRSLDNSSYGDY